jgi:outer membrane protein W
LTVSLTCLSSITVQAAGDASDRFAFDPGTAMFSANEFSLDLFGYHASRNKDGGHNDAWGPGVAGNYFFTENLGIGAETYADAFESPYLLNILGTFRWPIPSLSMAPYGIAGVGRQWDHAAQWLGHIGAGVEYRFNAKTGTFLDIRRVFAANSPDYTLVRFGVRLAF